MDETVTISKGQYEQLKQDSQWLAYLESAGVDNWQGIDEAIAQARADGFYNEDDY